MKAMKKKIFSKATFLVLALMMMLTPLNLGVFAETAEMPETTIIDECCLAEESVVIGEQPMVVEMATDTDHTHTDSCYTPFTAWCVGGSYDNVCSFGTLGCKGGSHSETWYQLNCPK